MRAYKTIRSVRDWHKWFAWYPVEAGDKDRLCLVWLECVERQWRDDMNFRLDFTGYGAYEGGWSYRVLPSNT